MKAKPRKKTKKSKVKVAVIGLGMGNNHVKSFQQYKRAELIGVCDLDPNRLAPYKDTVKYCVTDYKELLALEELDAVSVALPNFLHAKISIEAMKAGKHVQCEKPLAMNTKEAEEMLKVSKETGCKLVSILNNRFRDTVQFGRRLIKKGKLGQILYAKTGWLRRSGIPGGGDSWFHKKGQAGGGPLIDLGVHVIDMTMYMVGSPEPVSVQAAVYNQHIGKKKPKDYDVEDLAVAFIRFANDFTLFAEASWSSHIGNEAVYSQVVGSKGGLEIGNPHTYEPMRLFTFMEDREVDLLPRFGRHDAYAEQMRSFIDCVADDTEPICSGEDGIRIMKILDAIYESGNTGREVRIK